MEKIINIAIDGPSGSGKSTLASAIAKHYGFIYIDTGALYRTVGLYIQRQGFASDDKENIIASLPNINIDMRLEGGKGVVTLDGVPVGDEIRTPKSSMYASDVSKIPEVRAFLLNLQRDIAKRNSTVMDGRDRRTDRIEFPFNPDNIRQRNPDRFQELKTIFYHQHIVGGNNIAHTCQHPDHERGNRHKNESHNNFLNPEQVNHPAAHDSNQYIIPPIYLGIEYSVHLVYIFACKIIILLIIFIKKHNEKRNLLVLQYKEYSLWSENSISLLSVQV